MNDTAIKNFCTWARNTLIEQVETRMRRFSVVEANALPEDATSVDGMPLSPDEQRQRSELLRLQREVGHAALAERAAYTWFNRLVAIRFMELHDYLPCRVRMLSADDGSFAPQVLKCALDVQIEGLDASRVMELMQAGDDEALFRCLFLAQCDELSSCIPGVFDRVGGAMELLLPDGLLRQDSVIDRLVTSIPEEDWERVEILGWMYQYYNAEVKDAFFKSKAKETPDTIGPATQLFTPEWIVRYMVENSLGRLWMLNFPESMLCQKWDYYIAPDAEHEDFIRINGPEDITLCDPACGSGHILVYAFQLLFDMYAERGHREREIPQLILEKNLSGMEIDPRAAQIANLALAMCAREHDRRFFGRGVQADVLVVIPTKFQRDEAGCVIELPEDAAIMADQQFIEVLEHLDEVGSLLNPTEAQLEALRADAARFAAEAGGGSLFGRNLGEKLQDALRVCEALARKFDCVVANPPYMGLRKFGPWLFTWIKHHYSDCSSDLYACFLARGFDMTLAYGYCSMVTMSTWVTDKGLLSLRKEVITHYPIIAMLQMEANVMPIAFDTTSTVFCNSSTDLVGTYADVSIGRLNEDRVLPSAEYASLERYYRAASFFRDLPDSVFAFTVTASMVNAFSSPVKLADLIAPRVGIQTGDTDRFVKDWWEIEASDGIRLLARSDQDQHGRWVPYKNGGDFRKWYGNAISLVDWGASGEVLIGKASSEKRKVMSLPAEYRFKPFVSWCDYGLGKTSVRFCECGALFDVIEPAFVDCSKEKEAELTVIQAFANSSTADRFIQFFMPGRHKNVRKMGELPLLNYFEQEPTIKNCVEQCRNLSKLDWDSFEISWDFKRHPLL